MDNSKIIEIPSDGRDVEIEYEGSGKLIVRWNYPDLPKAGRPRVPVSELVKLIGTHGIVSRSNVEEIAGELNCCTRTVWRLWAEVKKGKEEKK